MTASNNSGSWDPGGAAARIFKLKFGAIAVLILALVAIAVAMWLSLQPATIQGPFAMAARPDGRLWLAVDKELWLVSAHGVRERVIKLDRVAQDSTGVANLSALDDDSVLLNFRGQASVHRLNGATGAVLSTVKLSTSPHMLAHLIRAPTMAVHPDGRVAFGTGGGHTVLVFDSMGREVASTLEGTYRFTNGLWWSHDGLWTTDTNRFMLKRLNPASAKVTASIQLNSDDPHRYLGVAVASMGSARQLSGPVPLASVIRLSEGMTRGQVADVFVDGSERRVGTDQFATFAPRDLVWLKGTDGPRLLVTDGDTYQVRRFNAMGQAMPDFGDAALQQGLRDIKAKRLHLQWAHQLALALAVALFCLGGWLAWRMSKLEKTLRLAELDAQLTVVMEERKRFKPWPMPISSASHLAMGFNAFWPLYALACLGLLTVALWPTVLVPTLRSSAIAPFVLTNVWLRLAWLGLMLWVAQKWVWQQSLKPALEPLFNQAALKALGASEAVREALHHSEYPMAAATVQSVFRPHLLVLTSQRLLWFSQGASRLQRSQSLSDIVQADLHHEPRHVWRRWLAHMGLTPRAELSLHLRDGSRILASVVSPVTVRRMVKAINAESVAASQFATHVSAQPEDTHFEGDTVIMAAAPDAGAHADVNDSEWGANAGQHPCDAPKRQSDRHLDAPPAVAPDSHLRHAALSALIPGLGQWAEGRFASGVLQFCLWAAFLLGFAAPVLHAAWLESADVTAQTLTRAWAGLLMLHLASAFDAWRMAPRGN